MFVFFLSQRRNGWNALALRWTRYCCPFVVWIIWPCWVWEISLMSGDFFSCLRTLRVPLSECFIIYSLTDCVIKSRVKLVEVWRVELQSWVAPIESESPPIKKNCLYNDRWGGKRKLFFRECENSHNSLTVKDLRVPGRPKSLILRDLGRPKPHYCTG